MLNASHIAVVGAGPTGLAAALALARPSVPLVLAGPRAKPQPGRTVALLGGSVRLVEALGAWDACAKAAARIDGIRLIDDTGGLLRAPETLFTAAECGLPAFGWNVPNDALAAALEATVSTRPEIVRHGEAVTAVRVHDAAVRLTAADGGTIEARLAVGADGRGSLCREASGLDARRWSYPQTAVVAMLTHARPHGFISTELHRRAGPLTVVPLPGRRSSLVWVETAGEAERLMALDSEAFARELERRLQGLLGAIDAVTDRAAFPLAGLTAERAAARRIALVGEAAHVFPPIGAQGLNLGMRDVAHLADCVGDADAAGEDPGGPAVLQRYETARRTDIETRTLAVDLLNRSLLADLLPVDLARGAALHAVAALRPLRDVLVRGGLAASGAPPRLMRPQGS